MVEYSRAGDDETFRGISRAAYPGWPGWPLIDEAKETVGSSAVSIIRHFEHDSTMAKLVNDFYISLCLKA